MRVPLCLLLLACACAAQDESRAKKQPIVVDAVGNTLPPPSNVPATVGSPVNLLTPDRYEFYTFDESGELVKRLMTLEEIQAIVAAGEEAEGLVTLANDKQPTSATNYSQPPYTVLHSVVTNVKNVLKEQMEAHKTAHKKNPMFQPTLDTPDVSDSWSLILPSIFGNTGLDIVPDKTSSGDTTPETEMMEIEQPRPEEEDNLSKEGNNDIPASSTTEVNEDKDIVGKIPVEEEKNIPTTSSTTTTTTTTTSTTTRKPTTTTTTTTTTPKPTTTTTEPTTTTKAPTTTTTAPTTVKTWTAPKVSTTTKAPTTTKNPITKPPTKATTLKEVRSTTKRSPTQTTSTTSKPRISSTTTSRPLATASSTKARVTTTTSKPITTTKVVRITPKITTPRPLTTKKQPFTSTTSKTWPTTSNLLILNNTEDFETERSPVQYEKVSTFVPISTVTYITEKSTQTESQTAKPTTAFASTTKRSVTTTTRAPSTLTTTAQPTVTTYKPTMTTSSYIASTTQNQDLEKLNVTTITTQSVSPSTTVSSTEFIALDNTHLINTEAKPTDEVHNNENNEPIIPLFDLAQSISQISSDLGSDYMPIPTVSNILESTKINGMDLESKENFEMDIPSETDTKKSNITDSPTDNFVKISTLDPHNVKDQEIVIEQDVSTKSNAPISTTPKIEVTTSLPESTTIDRILSESMGDLLSQVVNQAPQSMFDTEKSTDKVLTTTEANIPVSTTADIFADLAKTTTESIPTEKNVVKEELTNDIPKLDSKIPESKENSNNETNSIITEDKPTTEKVDLDVTNIPIKVTSENYVQISISNTNNELNTEKNTNNVLVSTNKLDSADKLETIKPEDSIKDSEIVSDIKGNQILSEPQKSLETTTVKLIETTKITPSEEKGQPIVLNKNDKVPEFLPKIDDFKKKIQKVNIDDKEFANERNSSWKLISTVSPPKANEIPKEKLKNGENGHKDVVLEFSNENQGLEVTTKDLEEDIAKFTELCNELAFRYWNTMVENIDKRRSFVLSPYSITSMLAMMFMGARGATSGEMNDILKLDDMVTFNPHFTLKNISDSIETTTNSGVIVSAFIRELYSDRNKGKILTFYKERAQHFYNGHVEEVNFKLISDIIRRRTNLLVKRYTWGKITEYMKTNSITMNPPLAAFSANIFQTDCTGSSVEGRDGEMYFVVSPNVRQRRLVPVPAVVYRGGFLAGYDPVLDATAAALGNTNSIISTLFLMPGQQGNVVHAEDLEALEQRLLDANPTTPTWNRLLRTLLPRMGLELQIPRFSHKSIFNVSSTLKNMGLKDLFDADHADLGGLNGPSKDLYLSDMIQSTTFVTCGEGVIGEQHHVEEYPESLGLAARRRASRWASDWDEPRDYQRAFHDPHDVGEAMHLPLHLRPRQARLPSRNAQPARLKFDRPFLYFVRHNPSGMILYVGRYNPRLLP